MRPGQELVDELRRRSLLSHFPYASIQVLKAASDAPGLRAALAKLGIEAERSTVLHFTDLIRIEILNRRLRNAGAAMIIFAIS